MKKILFILITSLFILSCSSDDDSATDNIDTYRPLIGKWVLEKSTQYKADGTVYNVSNVLLPCNDLSTLEYKTNGQCIRTTFRMSNGATECTLSNVSIGLWYYSPLNGYLISTFNTSAELLFTDENHYKLRTYNDVVNPQYRYTDTQWRKIN
ncbi:hypothetical protein CLV94_1976 [Flavobacterium endophyticum]|uniref:Lipocalin-like protein n=1 Tax=Flavobacterium endophyticum TaxID=1540163 RepID=A0A495ME93_9FLAO|nr:hypothetical protein [Flavobacterium endophyticum]RKS23073.1 hypothetical protein CLV94_1976 [Flavobacterium endophyticum]